MNKTIKAITVISLLSLVSLHSEIINEEIIRNVTAENIKLVKEDSIQDSLQDFVTHKEDRKDEIDQINNMVDTTVRITMEDVSKLINEMKELKERSLQIIQSKIAEAKKRLLCINAVNFKVKNDYPQQLKELQDLEKFAEANS